MKTKGLWAKWGIGIGLLSIFFILCFRSDFLNTIVSKKVKQELQQFSPKLEVSFSSINTHLFASSLSVNNLLIHYAQDSNHRFKDVFYFPSIEFSGINFLALVFKKKLLVNKVIVGKGEIKFDSLLLNKSNNKQVNFFSKIPFENIVIHHLELAETHLWVLSNHKSHPICKGSFEIDEINITKGNEAFSANNLRFGAIKSDVTEIDYPIPDASSTVEIKKLSINRKKGELQIDSLKIVPNNERSQFNRPEARDQVKATIAGIKVIKLDLAQLSADKLIAEKIIVNNTAVNIFNDNRNSLKLKTNTSLSTYLKKISIGIIVDSVNINHSLFTYDFSENGKSEGKSSFSSIPLKNSSIHHLQLTDIHVKTQTNNVDLLRFAGDINIDNIETGKSNTHFKNTNFHFTSIKLNLSEIQGSIPGTYSSIFINKLFMNSNKKTMQINDIKIKPKYDKYELGRKLRHQTDYIQATVSQIKITNLDAINLLNEKLVAGKIFINKSNVYIFRDRRLPRLLQAQPLPVTYLKNLPIDIRVNSLLINQASISYEEFPAAGLQPGTLSIEKVNLSLSPLINHPNSNHPDHMDMQSEGSIMGSGSMKASAYLPFNSQKEYVVEGSINNLDLPRLNEAAQNLGKFHIESGLLNTLSFRINLDAERATGEVVGEYHNLIVRKLKGNSKKIAWFPSFIVRHLIIPKNKDKTKPVANRTGKINYKRDPTRFLSFYLLQSLLSGVKSSFTFGFLLPH